MVNCDINFNETSHFLFVDDWIPQSFIATPRDLLPAWCPLVAEIDIFDVPEDVSYASNPHYKRFEWTFLENLVIDFCYTKRSWCKKA